MDSRRSLVVGAIVATAKQGWLGSWIAKKLPPAALPYLALVLGTLGVASAEIIAGKPVLQALIDGFVAGMGSIVGHDTLVEGMRGGKEIIPEKKSAFLDPPAPTKEAA